MVARTRFALPVVLSGMLGSLGSVSGCGDRTHPTGLDQTAPVCPATGYCTTTTRLYKANFGGAARGDAICASELPGSHFYRKSCDESLPFRRASPSFPGGYGETESGACMDCNGWATESGAFDPTRNVAGCAYGYQTVAALVPKQTSGASWRICEAGDWPLVCCVD